MAGPGGQGKPFAGGPSGTGDLGVEGLGDYPLDLETALEPALGLASTAVAVNAAAEAAAAGSEEGEAADEDARVRAELVASFELLPAAPVPFGGGDIPAFLLIKRAE